MPAETRVAEWIRAEAGTGASIESGSQKWKPSCADLQKEATQTHARKASLAETVRCPIEALFSAKTAPKWAALCTVEAPNQSAMQAAVIKAASLSLLKESALKALLSVVALEVQKLISRKELAPISSQPKISVNHEFAQTSSIIDNLKTSK